mmetsp:Transcript_87497/g.194497  ORF Transcript_87497/g.194497 Transcript_87497/m.194497 type:complete len:256 (-) Transcript_87497:37-804(-)
MALIDQPRALQSLFALDLDGPLLTTVVMPARDQPLMRRIADVDPPRNAMFLHVFGVPDGRSKEVVAGALLAHDASHNRAGMQANSHLHRLVVADTRQGPEQGETHLHSAHGILIRLRAILALRRLWTTRRDEVGIADDLHLVQCPVCDDLVEGRVHHVQEIHQVSRRHACRVGREALDVGEEDSDVLDVLGDRRYAFAYMVHDVCRQEVQEQRRPGSLGFLELLQALPDAALLVVSRMLEVLPQAHPTGHVRDED